MHPSHNSVPVASLSRQCLKKKMKERMAWLGRDLENILWEKGLQEVLKKKGLLCYYGKKTNKTTTKSLSLITIIPDSEETNC